VCGLLVSMKSLKAARGRAGRAQVQGRESGRRTAAAMREWEEASLTDLVLLPLLPYLAWALVYYAKARAR
jgi:hypothetical protein